MAAGCGLLWFGLAPVVPLLALALIALAQPPSLGWTTRFLAGLPLMYCVDLVLVFLSADALETALVWLVVPAGLVARRGLAASACSWRLEDTWAALAAAVTGFVLIEPWSRRSVSGQLAYLRLGVDNAGHLGIVNAIRTHGTFVTGAHSDDVLGLVKGLRDYPQGAHANVALLSHVVAGDGHGVAVGVQAYSLAMLVSTTVMVVAVAVLAMRFAAASGAPAATSCVAAAAVVAAVLAGPPLALLTEGFFAQIVALSAVALSVGLSMDLRCRTQPGWLLTVAAACSVVVASSFYFVLPVMALPVLSIGWSARRWVRQHGWLLCALLLGSIALGAPSVWASLGTGAADALNAPGGVHIITTPLLVLVASGAVLMLLRALTDSASRILLTPWGLALLAAIAFSLALRVYEQATTGALSYYYFKSLYTVYLLAVGAVGGGAALACAAAVRHSRAVTWGIGVTSALGLAVVLQAQSVTRGTDLANEVNAPRSDATFQRALALQPRPQRRPVLFWKLTSVLDDYKRNRQLGAIYQQDTRERWTACVQGYYQKQRPRVLVQLIHEVSGITLYTSDPGLRHELIAAGVTREEAASVTIVLFTRPS